MLSQEWNIQARALHCAKTARPFEKGERIFSALYWRDGQYQRVDLCEEAWQARNDNIEPLSAWQTEFVPPPPPEPEALKKDDAESLLRRLVAENAPGTRNARYILALMLERKKVLRQIERQKQDGASVLVYEHLPSGEVWLIDDPGLKLGELTHRAGRSRAAAGTGRGDSGGGGSGRVSRRSGEHLGARVIAVRAPPAGWGSGR